MNNIKLSKQATRSLLRDIKQFTPDEDRQSALDYLRFKEIDSQLEQRAIEATIHGFDAQYC